MGIFNDLDYEDRKAFFELMDDYFASRPNLFSNGQTQSAPSTASTAGSLAASHAQSFASKNPQMTANLISSGVQHQAAANPQSKWSGALSNSKVSGALGKLGAAGLAGGAAAPPSATSASQPPPPPTSGKQRAQGVSGLVSGKSFGHLDTSSKMGAMKTMFKDPNAAPAPYVPPPQPAAPSPSNSYSKPRNNLPPPPTRRVAPSAPAPVYDEPEPEQEEEGGDYAEAMYDFTTAEPGDLPLKAKQVVLVLEKVSDDWWKCRDPKTGSEGLTPSAYLKEI